MKREIYTGKLKEIDDIFKLWIGGFIKSNSAISDIGKILDRRSMSGYNLICKDKEGNIIFKADTAIIE